MSVAIVHDWLNQIGGAENVLEALAQQFARPPIYTSMYWSALARQRPAFAAWDIHTSFMQRLPGVFRHHQAYLPLYPLAFEQFDLSRYELVLSNKSGFCHGVITGPETLHLCYCLTPTRFIWSFDAYLQREEGFSRLSSLVLRPLLNYLRVWDRLAADRVNHFIAISRAVQMRIQKYYGRDSVIIYPPVDTERFVPSGRPPGDYYLAGGRLIPYKRVDLAVRAFTQLGRPLLVYGEGRDLDSLRGRPSPSWGTCPGRAWCSFSRIVALSFSLAWKISALRRSKLRPAAGLSSPTPAAARWTRWWMAKPGCFLANRPSSPWQRLCAASRP